MRNITKNIQLPIDGKPVDFRLTKLDAFSGAALLQLLARLPSVCHSERSEESPAAPPAGHPERSKGFHPRSSQPGTDSSLLTLFAALSPADLRSLMTSCLNHVEVLLPAGYQPVMQGSAWAWPELEHDPVSCLKLTVECIAWSLSGFFGGGDLRPPPEPPASSP